MSNIKKKVEFYVLRDILRGSPLVNNLSLINQITKNMVKIIIFKCLI